jgi:hypothetical protein
MRRSYQGTLPSSAVSFHSAGQAQPNLQAVVGATAPLLGTTAGIMVFAINGNDSALRARMLSQAKSVIAGLRLQPSTTGRQAQIQALILLSNMLATPTVNTPETARLHGVAPTVAHARQSSGAQPIALDANGNQVAVTLPSTWAWGLDVNGNPVPMDSNGNPIPLPTGAVSWGRAVSTTTPITPSPPGVSGATPSMGVVIGFGLVAVAVGYAIATRSERTARMNPRHRRRHRR